LRGVCQCSPKDRFKRKLGLKIAQGRLERAIRTECDDNNIQTLKYGRTLYGHNSFETVIRIFFNAYKIGRTPVWVTGKSLPHRNLK
jgi:hypothetical protein